MQYSLASAKWLVCAIVMLWVVELAYGAPLQPCRLPGLPNEILCGNINRPLNPAAPGGVRIDIAYAILPSLNRHKYPDPLFVLAGGPGQSAIDLASTMAVLFRRINQQRDLILVDQRGTGRSAPLRCNEQDRQPLAAMDLAKQVPKILQCLKELSSQSPWHTKEGLAWFTTHLAVQDFEAIRQQLGLSQVNLIGASYGTRVALEWLRVYPQHVRRVVLDGVAPPDMALPKSSAIDGEASLEVLLRSCELDEKCSLQHPNLRQVWQNLLTSVPREIEAFHPLDGRHERFTLTKDMLAALIRGPLYMPSLAYALPAALDAASKNQWGGLLGLNAVLGSDSGPDSKLALGMHFSVICAEDPYEGFDTSALQWNTGVANLYAQVCREWPKGSVPAEFKQLPKNTGAGGAGVPVLLLSGGLDPITPPRHGQRVAKALGPLALHLVIPNGSHGLMAQGCVSRLIAEFFQGTPEQALSLEWGCAQNIPSPFFFEPPKLEALSHD